MKTSAPPVSASVSEQAPTVPTSNDPVAVSIVMSQPPSPQEQIYLRWSTDTFVTSNMIVATLAEDGSHFSAIIPPQQAGTSVEYCIATSTLDLTHVVTSGIIDSLTLSTTPHSHYVVAGATPTATPSPTPSATPLPMPPAPPMPVLSGLTYNGGTAFTNGTDLIAGTVYTVTAQASSNTQSVVFVTNGRSATVSLASFSFTFTAPSAIGAYTLMVTPWNWVKGTGTSGLPVTISYNVVAAATPTPTPSSTPSPTPSATPTQTIQVTVQTSPAGRSFTIDGAVYSGTQSFSWAPGSSHSVATTSPQSGGTGVQYVWKSWSDSGSISHTIAPTTNKTYTVTFTTQYYLTMSAGTGGTATPVSGWKNGGAVVSLKATPTNNTSGSYNFTGWTGTGTGSYSGPNNPASITMNGPITENASFTQNPVQVTVQTNPVGRTFSVDGTPYTSAQVFSWQPGSSHTVATTSPQSGGTGVQYVWKSWSDSGSISHTIAPTTNKTYTVTFTTQYYLTMSAGTGGTVTPVSGWKNSGAAVSISARRANGYSFTNWTGTGTGSYSGANSSASITMGGPITETGTFTHN